MMADEPHNIIPVMLGDSRATHDGCSAHRDKIEMRPTDIEKQLDDGEMIVWYSPGQSSETQVEATTARIRRAFKQA